MVSPIHVMMAEQQVRDWWRSPENVAFVQTQGVANGLPWYARLRAMLTSRGSVPVRSSPAPAGLAAGVERLPQARTVSTLSLLRSVARGEISPEAAHRLLVR